MHFAILVEDASGEIALDCLLIKILGPQGSPHTWKIKSYKGIGRLPKDLRVNRSDPSKRQLLDNLHRLLKGYGRAYQNITNFTVIVVVDLDNRDCMEFKNELLNIHRNCNPAPRTLFRIAIEEIEAWFFGDKQAIKSAYPKAKENVLDNYLQDSICNTWEKLADAVFTGGSAALNRRGWPSIGKIKCEWAEKITPHIDVQKNKSRSFQVFRDGLTRLASSMN